MTGSIVTIDDAIPFMPIEKILAQINPVQAGTGDPSPDNIRPISGWDGLNVWVENEYDPTAEPTVEVSWETKAGTVYGGTLDVVSGLLTVDRVAITLDGSSDEQWVKHGSGSASAYAMRVIVPNFKFVQQTVTAWSNYLPSIDNSTTWGNYDVFLSMNQQGLVTGIRTITSVADWREYLASNPLEVVYELTTPQTYQLTPQQISTIAGHNNVWVDTGDVSVTYQSTSGSTPVRTSFKSPLKNYSYSALKMFGNTFIEHGKG